MASKKQDRVKEALSEIVSGGQTQETPQEPEQQADPIKPIGIGLKVSEWDHLEQIAGELGMTRHALAMWAIRDFMRRYDAGEIETKTETKKALA